MASPTTSPVTLDRATNPSPANATRLQQWWRLYARSVRVLAVGLAITAIVVLYARSRARERRQLHFEARGSQIAETLRTAFQVPLEVAAHLPALMNSVPEVDRRTFDAFVSPAIARHPAIAGLEWAPLVRGPEREAFERRARTYWPNGYEIRDVGEGGRMVRAPERATYLPLLFFQPVVEPIIGYDASVERTRRADQQDAIRAGEMRASQRIQLIEDAPGVWSVVIYAPVYHPGAAIATEAQRVAAFRGFGVELFRFKPHIERALSRSELRGIDFALQDLSAPQNEQLLYESRRALLEASSSSSLRWHRDFHYLNRRWRVTFRGDPKEFVLGYEALVLGLFGALLSFGAAAALRTAHVLERLEKKVEEAQRLGQYTLTNKLGAGGMGTVYKAEHAMLRRPTAIKVLNADSESHLARFEREVQATAALTHPNTITIYDYGRTDDGQFYYVMEYLSGFDLERVVTVTGPMPTRRALHLMRGVCEALAEAHAAGLVHRDIKPANLMVCVERAIPDFVKVLDFGLVKSMAPSDSKLSLSNTILGTPDYIAPESVTNPNDVTASVDIYALGAVLYWLVTGRTLFTATNTMGILMCHVTTPPPRPSSHVPLSPRLEALILKCLAKNPEERPATVLEMLAEVEACARDEAPWTHDDARAWWAANQEKLSKTVLSSASVSQSALGVKRDLGMLGTIEVNAQR